MIFQFLLPFITQIAIGLGLMVLAYLIMPRPKSPKQEFRDLQYPTADAGRPIPIIFGTKNVTAPNVLHHTEKSTRTYKVKA